MLIPGSMQGWMIAVNWLNVTACVPPRLLFISCVTWIFWSGHFKRMRSLTCFSRSELVPA